MSALRDIKLDEWEIKTLITIIDHVRNLAQGERHSSCAIDRLCRKDCADRWLELRNRLVSYVGDPAPKEKK